jgi:hypothetical protein
MYIYCIEDNEITGANMNAKEWAEKLNGIEYPADEICSQRKAIKADGLIVAYGMSDDILEFNGAIDYEVGAYQGITVKLTPSLSVFNSDENADTFEYNSREIALFPEVTAIWSPTWIDASWDIAIDLPHEVFKEDGELFGRGIVFEAKAIEDYCK